ncbi:MAG: EcoAI/FtnUII family type I restriction enzme subunit R [Christensenellales bacterium]
MSTIIPKNQMTEEDIKLNFITPALQSRGWKNKITMETKVEFTDGKINLKGNLISREKAKKADYILYINANNPIAIVEAKDNNHTVSYGLQQAMTYARMLDIPFAYSSNGDAFYEHDFLTGIERQIPLDQFPTYDELYERFKVGANNGQGLTSLETELINQPYYTSQTTHTPRYYQRVAINRTIDAIAKGQNRLLLVMATGTGKTYAAFQIVYRLLKAGHIKKVLYLADRNILVDQSIQQDFSPLSKTIHKINFAKDDPTTITSHEVYFSLYQQLTEREDDDDDDVEETISRLSKLFNPDFFDLVIVDECHRGSAKKDSSWRKILEYFSSATQIGMTATPKETKYVSNIDYFGEPIYTYSLREGIDDGFLAPFRVIGINTDIGNGWRPYKDQRDIYGNVIEDRIYTNSDFDYNIVIEDRINQVAREITAYLKSTDRMQKTIVFCATEEHAERMRIALNNFNSDMVQKNPDYVVRITGSDSYGKSKLDYFISVSSQYPVVATTSKLLSTGADCKMTKLIVIDQMINSMTEFKQIIGRGTRLREKDGKTHFTVMDFRGVARLFADPEWDGPIEMDSDYDPNATILKSKTREDEKPASSPKPYIDVNGCPVSIVNKTVSIYDANGKLLRKENIIDYTKTNILGTYASLENFINKWTSEQKKEKIQELFRERGIDLNALKKEKDMEDVDDFDFICHVAFDQKPLTRKERANNVKKSDFLNKYGETARQILEILLDKYMNEGIYEIESINILKLDPIKKYGSPAKIVNLFGGKAGYMQAIQELGEELYKAA